MPLLSCVVFSTQDKCISNGRLFVDRCFLLWYVENKDGVKGHRFWYYFIRALNVHFLVLLCIKLFADSILELDKIWGIELFNSIKDVQTLIGYIVTLLIRQNIKIDPGVDRPKQFTENKLDIRISEDK